MDKLDKKDFKLVGLVIAGVVLAGLFLNWAAPKSTVLANAKSGFGA